MKKSLLLFFVVCFTLWGGDGYANECVFGSSGTCAVDTTGNDWYYWCTSPDDDCAGISVANRNKHISVIGKTEYICGVAHTCCGNQLKAVRTTVENEKEEVKSKNGVRSCTYKKIVDQCGKEVSTPCNPECSDGQVSHPFSGECVAPCPDGKVFESEMSTRCIECPTTAHSGVVRVVNEDEQYLGSYCKTCNGTSQIFDSRNPVEKYVGAKTLKEKAEYSAKNNPFLRRTGDITESKYTELCVDITNLPVLATKNQMSECALCPGDLFEDCVDCVNNNSCDSSIKQKCRLK